MHPRSLRTLLAVALHGLTLAAGANAQAPHGLRVTAQAVADWPTPAAFAERAAAVAAMPVRDVQVIGTRRYALSLMCRDDADCQQALARLRDPSFTAAVEIDARRSIPARPAASQSR